MCFFHTTIGDVYIPALKDGGLTPKNLIIYASYNPNTSFSKPSLFRSSANNSSVISFSERNGVY